MHAQAAALIAADLPITSTYSDEANERRTWEIAGFARVLWVIKNAAYVGNVFDITPAAIM